VVFHFLFLSYLRQFHIGNESNSEAELVEPQEMC
jgi:hypothetical protein